MFHLGADQEPPIRQSGCFECHLTEGSAMPGDRRRPVDRRATVEDLLPVARPR